MQGLGRHQQGNFPAAGGTPGGPEVDQDILASQWSEEKDSPLLVGNENGVRVFRVSGAGSG